MSEPACGRGSATADADHAAAEPFLWPTIEERLHVVALSDDYGRPAMPSWQGVDWANHEQEMLVARRRLHYLDVGEGGFCFVLVHGFGGAWQNWIACIPALAQHARVVAVDLPGFGDSEPAHGDLSVEACSAVVVELLQRLDIATAVVVGHSMGGPIAIQIGGDAADVVAAVVDLGGAAYQAIAIFGGRKRLHYALRRPQETRAIVTERLTAALPAPPPLKRIVKRSPRLRRAFLSPYVHDPDALDDALVGLLIDHAGSPHQAVARRMIGAMIPTAGVERLGGPLLVAGGSHDRICPPGDVQRFRRELPWARSLIFEGCGHLAMIERPQAFADVLLHFSGLLDDSPASLRPS